MPQVQRIDPIVLPSEKVTVAAYCRVSTNSEDQANSYNTQIAYYTKLISENPDWELVDIYADRGISGTSMAKRDEFNRMLADCREGKIKRVLVKSVSRFARNTTELLEITRELKDLGVVVVFEEQGYDTSQVLGEMQLAMYAMAAQEESNSISKNMRWSYQKRMSTGEFIGTVPPFGYDMVNGSLIPNEDANVVKNIFSMYINGMGMEKIASILNQNNSRKRKWNRTSIAFILKNERYAGNALLQKRFRTEEVPYTRKVNHGELPQYFIQDSHDNIISDAVFDRCQRLMLCRKDSRKEQGEHLFTHKIMCPHCKRHYREVESSGKKYWICPTCEKNVYLGYHFRLQETVITIASLNMMSGVFLSQSEILNRIMSLLREIEFKQSGTDTKLFELDQSIAALNNKSLTLQKLSNKGFISPDEFCIQREALATRRKKLTAERNKKLHGLQSHSAIEKLEELQAILSSWPGAPTEFDIDQFDEVVEKIIPTADNKLIFRLHCGLELTEEISS